MIDVEVIAMVELGGLGDTIMTLPAMAAVRAGRPAARIVRVHGAAMSDFIAGCPHADDFVAYERDRGKLVAGARLLGALRRRGVSTIVNLHTPDFDRQFGLYLRDSLFGVLSGASRRLGYYHSVDRLLLTDGVSRRTFGRLSMADEELRIVRPLLPETEIAPEVRYWLGVEERATALGRMREQAARSGIDAKAYFCVSPFARSPSRTWSSPRLAEAVTRVALELKLAPVLLGGAADRPKLPALSHGFGVPVLDLVGRNSLREAAAILEGARLAIAVDSGLMHLAALVRTAVVGIFGPSDVTRWRPMPLAPFVAVRGEASCSPCYRRECPDDRCLSTITSEAVVEAALTLVRRS
jgi:ADP-heptose:LPS heptosyltransferase